MSFAIFESILSGGVLHHGEPAVPRSAQRGPQRVPDEPRPFPQSALPPGELSVWTNPKHESNHIFSFQSSKM